MSKKYRAVVIGCGKIGVLFEAEKNRPKPASHAGAVTENSKTELVALADPNAHNRTRAKKLFPHATYYESADLCIDEQKPDIVIIATPAIVRIPIVRACLKAGVKIIICEKPLSHSVRGAHMIEAELKDSNTIFVLNYQRRFSRLFQIVRDDIERGKLGAIQQVTCHYSNGIYNNGGHVLDAILYLLNEVPVSVIGITNKKNTTFPAGDTNIDALVSMKSGATVSLQSLDQGAYGILDIKIYGENGAIYISEYGQRATWIPARPSMFDNVKQLDHAHERSQREPLSATQDALAHAIFCSENKQKSLSGVHSGVLILRILEALKKSAHSGGKRSLL